MSENMTVIMDERSDRSRLVVSVDDRVLKALEGTSVDSTKPRAGTVGGIAADQLRSRYALKISAGSK